MSGDWPKPLSWSRSPHTPILAVEFVQATTYAGRDLGETHALVILEPALPSVAHLAVRQLDSVERSFRAVPSISGFGPGLPSKITCWWSSVSFSASNRARSTLTVETDSSPWRKDR